jgi:hypothetical protein
MHPLSQLAHVGAVTVSALVLTGCAAMNVHSYAERGVDFAQYHTYNWASADERTTGDPRLDNNPFFQERIQAEVERQLTRRGYRKETSERPDLTVRYRARINQEVNVNGADRQPGYCEKGDCEPYVFEAGTLLFDLVDAQTNQVVWRGWAEGSVDGVVNNQEWMEQKIDEVVARIFEKCPRRT